MKVTAKINNEFVNCPGYERFDYFHVLRFSLDEADELKINFKNGKEVTIFSEDEIDNAQRTFNTLEQYSNFNWRDEDEQIEVISSRGDIVRFDFSDFFLDDDLLSRIEKAMYTDNELNFIEIAHKKSWPAHDNELNLYCPDYVIVHNSKPILDSYGEFLYDGVQRIISYHDENKNILTFIY